MAEDRVSTAQPPSGWSCGHPAIDVRQESDGSWSMPAVCPLCGQKGVDAAAPS